MTAEQFTRTCLTMKITAISPRNIQLLFLGGINVFKINSGCDLYVFLTFNNMCIDINIYLDLNSHELVLQPSQVCAGSSTGDG